MSKQYTPRELGAAQAAGNVIWTVHKDYVFIGRFRNPRNALNFALRNDGAITPDIITRPRQFELEI